MLGLVGRGFVMQETGEEGVEGSRARRATLAPGQVSRRPVCAPHPQEVFTSRHLTCTCVCVLQFCNPVAVTKTMIWGFEEFSIDSHGGKAKGKQGTGAHYERAWLSAFLGKG